MSAVPKQFRRRGRTRRPRSIAGAFTLLEVLVALGIFTMAAVVLASAYLNILNAYDLAGRGAGADADVAFARTLLLNEPDRTKVEQGSEFDSAEGRHVRWSAEIASTNEADLFAVTFTCEVTDSGQQRGEPQKTVQTFTLLRPTWSIDPAERSKLREDAKKRILQMQETKK